MYCIVLINVRYVETLDEANVQNTKVAECRVGLCIWQTASSNRVQEISDDNPSNLNVQEHVLPMIPGGASFKEIITEGDGRTIY